MCQAFSTTTLSKKKEPAYLERGAGLYLGSGVKKAGNPAFAQRMIICGSKHSMVSCLFTSKHFFSHQTVPG
jgi:hypothetical protein